MKYAEIQTELLKAVIKGKNLGWGVHEDSGVITLNDGKSIWIIPEDKFLLNMIALKNKRVQDMDVLKLLKLLNENDYTPAKLTGFSKDVEIYHKKVNCLQIKNDTTVCYVQKAFLKYFEPDEIRIKSPVDIVRIYENGELAGGVLPIKVQEEQQ